jgi:hypothetical protein
MALQVEGAVAAERDRIEPHVAALEAVVRDRDPSASFSLRPGHMPEYWELDARVASDTADDEMLATALADLTTDILVDHDIAIAVVLLPRQQ